MAGKPGWGTWLWHGSAQLLLQFKGRAQTGAQVHLWQQAVHIAKAVHTLQPDLPLGLSLRFAFLAPINSSHSVLPAPLTLVCHLPPAPFHSYPFFLAVVNPPDENSQQDLDQAIQFFSNMAEAGNASGLGLCAVLYALRNDLDTSPVPLAVIHTGGRGMGKETQWLVLAAARARWHN